MPRKPKAAPVEAPTMPQERSEPQEATQTAPIPPWPGREHARGEGGAGAGRVGISKAQFGKNGKRLHRRVRDKDTRNPAEIALPAPRYSLLAHPPDELCWCETPATTRARWPSSLGAPGWPRVLGELRRAMPWEVACYLHGIAPLTAFHALAECAEAAAEVQGAKAQGEAYLLADTRLDPRERQWRLERLYPKRYHLPTKVTGVPEEEGGTPIGHRVTLELSDARDLARGRVIDATARVLDTSAAPQIPAENDTSSPGEYRPEVSRSADGVTKRTG